MFSYISKSKILSRSEKNIIGCNLIIMLIFLLPWYCISSTLSNIDSLKTEQQVLLINQIPEAGRYTGQLINQAESFIAQNKNLSVIPDEVENMFILLNENLELLGDSTRPFNREQLNKKERELDLMNQQLDRWQLNTQQINKERTKKTAAIDSILVIWQHTYDSLHRSIIYYDSIGQIDTNLLDIKTDIENFIGSLTVANNELSQSFADLEKLRTRITLLENKLVSVSNYLQYHKENLIQDIWIPESPPIWEVKSDTIAFVEEQEILTSIKSDYNIIIVFWKNHPLLPYQLMLYFLLILGTILYLRLKARKLFADFGDKLHESKIVLQHPVLSSLIICWFGSLIFTFFSQRVERPAISFNAVPVDHYFKEAQP